VSFGLDRCCMTNYRYEYEFWVRSGTGKNRIVVCSEDRVEQGDPALTQKYHASTGIKSYRFKDGERAAQIGDVFLDSAGEIYRRITSAFRTDRTRG
jgi:hypothetical protein